MTIDATAPPYCCRGDCRAPAAGSVRTGSDGHPFQVDDLCARCLDEHWRVVAPVVAAGVMHYTVGPPGCFDRLTGEWFA